MALEGAGPTDDLASCGLSLLPPFFLPFPLPAGFSSRGCANGGSFGAFSEKEKRKLN